MFDFSKYFYVPQTIQLNVIYLNTVKCQKSSI